MKKIFISMLLILSATPIFNVKADTNSTESCGIDQSVVEENTKIKIMSLLRNMKIMLK